MMVLIVYLLLLTGDREYGETTLPSSGVALLALRVNCKQNKQTDLIILGRIRNLTLLNQSQCRYWRLDNRVRILSLLHTGRNFSISDIGFCIACNLL